LDETVNSSNDNMQVGTQAAIVNEFSEFDEVRYTQNDDSSESDGEVGHLLK
jgi:hypothetical protein